MIMGEKSMSVDNYDEYKIVRNQFIITSADYTCMYIHIRNQEIVCFWIIIVVSCKKKIGGGGGYSQQIASEPFVQLCLKADK